MRAHSLYAFGVAGAALLSGCQPSGPDQPHTTLGANTEALRSAFNADSTSVRVLMLVSPTCGVCLRGAADLQKSLLAAQPDPRLRTYVVWVPMLNGQEKDVPVATRFVPDERARHFWDGEGQLMRAYTQTFSLSEPAWDLYLIYAPGTTWEDELPPMPHFWMHQLGSHDRPRVPGPFLEPSVIADSANRLLGAT